VFLGRSARTRGEGGQPVLLTFAAPGPGRGFVRAAVGTPFEPGSADVDDRGHAMRVPQRIAQGEVGPERMAAHHPALIAEVRPQGVKICNELV